MVSACADGFDLRRDVGIAPYKDRQNPVGRDAHITPYSNRAKRTFSLHSSLFTLHSNKKPLPLGSGFCMLF